MKYVRFAVDGQEFWGRLDGARIRQVEGDLYERPRESARESVVDGP